MRDLLLIAILCLFSNSIFSQEIRTYKETEDGIKLYLSVEKPSVESKENSTIVFFHGGDYNGGSPLQFARHTEYFVSRGLTVVNVHYRIRNVHNSKPMQSVSDGKAAIRHVLENYSSHRFLTLVANDVEQNIDLFSNHILRLFRSLNENS